MRQQILEALKAKFQGVSEAILGRVADKLAKTTTTEDQVKAAVEGVTFQQVLEQYGDSRATEAQHTAVQNYEKKYGLKDGSKVEPAPDPEKLAPGGDVPAWAQTLIDSNKQLNDRLNKMDAERTTNERRQQYNSIVDRLPENLRKGYQRASIEDLTDEQFKQLVTDVTTEVEGITTSIAAKGAVFGRPAAQHGQQEQNGQLTEQQIKAINARDTAGDEAQPF